MSCFQELPLHPEVSFGQFAYVTQEHCILNIAVSSPAPITSNTSTQNMNCWLQLCVED